MATTGALVTVTPNASLDVTLEVPGFHVGAVHRAIYTQAVAGGKGLNVARIAHGFGWSVEATGFTAGTTGQRVVAHLHALGITTAFVDVPGETRSCYAVLDVEAGSETEIRESGPSIEERDADALVAHFASRLADAPGATVAFCGSLPPGAPSDVYARLIDVARRAGSPSILDSSGEAFLRGLRAGPTVVKPNQAEFAEARGQEVPEAVVSAEPGSTTDVLARGLDDFRLLCGDWFDHGVEFVVVSLGAAGAVAAARHAAFRVWSPRVEVVSSVGCGDALVAGLAMGLPTIHDAVEPLRRAIALGASAARESVPGVVRRSIVDALAPHVLACVKREYEAIFRSPAAGEHLREGS